MRNILIIGAYSEIAKNCCYLWSNSNTAFYLVGRDIDKLKKQANELLNKGAKNVVFEALDFNSTDGIEPMLNNAFNEMHKFDIALISYGNLPNQSLCEENLSYMVSYLKSDAVSTVAIMSLISNRFEVARKGQLIIVSSVAGEVGKASNYVYGSSKALITCFASGLRKRLYKSNVIVTTVLPGLVDTPMTKHFKKGFFWSKPETIGKLIVYARGNLNRNIYTPSFWMIIVFLLKLMPIYLVNKLKPIQ